MTKKPPVVSVIIPTHNRAEMLRRAINSVLAQTYQDLEIIVVDDDSVDNTDEVIISYDDPRIIFLKHDHQKGSSAARNTGIKVCKGEYIAFLDDDDEWLPMKLEKQLLYLDSQPENIGMLYCWMDYYDAKGRIVYKHYPKYKGYVFPHVLDSQRIGGCPTLLVRRAVIEKVGGFDELLPRGNDGDFIRRICLHYKVDFIPEVLVKVNIGHKFQRITRSDAQGILDAIKGNRTKLIKFKNELHKYPKQTANIYAIIAHHHSQLRNWRNSITLYWKAFITCPFSPKLYVSLLRSLQMCIKKPLQQ